MIISTLENKKVIQTPVSDVEFSKKYDVIIVGVGTAGAMAAMACGDEGLSVLGIEAFTCLGGTCTVGGIGGHYFGIPGGLYTEYDRVINDYSKRLHSRLQGKKIMNEKLAIEKGAEFLYEATVYGIYIENGKTVGVAAVTKDGDKKNFACDILMDGTGDGVICCMAGCDSQFGRDMDGKTQPYTMVSLQKPNDNSYTVTNCDFGRVDQRDAKEVSDALIFSRAYEMPEEKKSHEVIYHSPIIGVREGRRIIAEEMINLPDIFEEKFTDTPAFYSWADLDKHGWDIAFDGETLGDWSIGANLGAYNVTIPISFKSLIPKGIDGLLVCCRALGIDRDISSCTRMVPDMKKIGEATAYIASLALKHKCALRDIPYGELKSKLEKTGCLGDDMNLHAWIAGKRDATGKNVLPPVEVTWIEDENKLTEILATDTPGIAIWSAKRMGLKKCEKVLMEGLASDDELLRRNCAFALSICQSTAALGEIRKMISERDPFLLIDCRKHNQRRSFMATYFAGRLKDRESAPILMDIITNKDEYKNRAYSVVDRMTTRYVISDFNNALFQQLSEACVALVRIGDAHADLRADIAKAFHTAFDDDAYIEKITTRPTMSSEYGMAVNIKSVAMAAAEKWGK